MNIYLILAYMFVWLIFMLYAWNLSRRQTSLKKDLEELRNKVEKTVGTSSSAES